MVSWISRQALLLQQLALVSASELTVLVAGDPKGKMHDGFQTADLAISNYVVSLTDRLETCIAEIILHL